ncbi:oligopeptide transport system permease protein [Peptoniphilus asaccharolyticus DSM 20463]|uniref:Oligopeptide transport system permease protein n=1 Tax=Peptoniphilus asaccharolyticus DSM 20463 TaxID=573058 RepID=A0A1W1V0K0_PEPAS|nr:ABC transporter permease [Peptoniphilus asaccharolyticus]MBL7575458.1 ABC transporter permease [Peptoniphilus asaccharolyticus]SMB86833.1 oligopeptide transport system permease protein [Peptoniphilus asaccharolyticus DSM 20463]
MLKFIGKRFAMSFLTIFFIITLTFFLMHAVPGNPLQQEGKIPATVYRNLEIKYGLDKPVFEQYKMYLSNVIKLDFGESMKSNTETVNQMIQRGFPVSLRLGLQALIWALIFGPTLGSLAALYQNRFPDYIAMLIAIIGISVPSFIMGTLLIQVVGRNLGLPLSGWGSFAHTIMPSIALCMMPTAQIARLMRSSMLEVLGQDYIKTAKSKGISSSAVILKHAVRNSILPIVSILGTLTADLLMGSFVVEKIFGIPGLGRFFIKAITDRDYTLIMGTTVFYGIVLVLMILLVDIAYVLVDPRIKFEGGGKA